MYNSAEHLLTRKSDPTTGRQPSPALRRCPHHTIRSNGLTLERFDPPERHPSTRYDTLQIPIAPLRHPAQPKSDPIRPEIRIVSAFSVFSAVVSVLVSPDDTVAHRTTRFIQIPCRSQRSMLNVQAIPSLLHDPASLRPRAPYPTRSDPKILLFLALLQPIHQSEPSTNPMPSTLPRSAAPASPMPSPIPDAIPRVPPKSAASLFSEVARGSGRPGVYRRSGIWDSSWFRCPRSGCAGLWCRRPDTV